MFGDNNILWTQKHPLSNRSDIMANFTLISILFAITLVIQVSGNCGPSSVVTRSTCSSDSRVTETTLTDSHVNGRSQVATSTLTDSTVTDSNISQSTLTGCRITRSNVRGRTYTGCVATDNDFSTCHAWVVNAPLLVSAILTDQSPV